MIAFWLLSGGPLLTVGCIPPPIDPAQPCAPYESEEDVFAVCIGRRVRSERTTAAAAKWCDQLSEAENLACRQSWTAGAATRAVRFDGTREDLLVFCKGSPDCGFFVLDQRPEGDYAVQAEACTKWTGKMAPDCIGHVGERFFAARPSDEDLKRVAEGPYGESALKRTLKHLACQKRTVCPDLGPMTENCNAELPRANQLRDLHCQ
ncbi:MAG: hypothetical protein EXR69_00685 [Myxococcales bacterium]|nr:hypothetical protein [Myxococcales bacterium]